MSPVDPADNELTATLAREAERFTATHGADLSMDRVMARAGEIRRGRRMRASMVMAAVVLAIAVPIGITVISDGTSNKGPDFAAEINKDPLTLAGLEAGKAPETYLYAGTLHTFDDELPLGKGGNPTGLARMKGGFLVARSDDHGNRIASFVGSLHNGPGQSWPIEGGFAVSESGNLGAFVEPDGTVVVVQDSGDRFFEIGKVPSGNGFDAVAAQGDNCSGRSEINDCRIWVNSAGEDPQAWTISPNESPSPVDGVQTMSALSNTSDVVGITSVSDTGTCSTSLTFGWETCDHRFFDFAPDGEHLVGAGSYGDGIGDTGLVIVNAKTGKVDLELKAKDGTSITSMYWEDADHVLATVYEANEWAVVRIARNGDRERALGPTTGVDEYSSPYLLPEG